MTFIRDEERPRKLGDIARRPGAWLPLIGASALIGTASTLSLPTVLGHAVDSIVAGADGGGWMWLAMGIIAAGVLSDLTDSYASSASLAGTAAWLRGTVVRHVLALGARPPRRFDTGDLVTRVSANSVDAARTGPGVVSGVSAVVPAAGSLVLLAMMDIWLAVAFLGGVALVAIVLRVFTSRTASVTADYQRVQGRLAARLTEATAGARTIAAAGSARREANRVLTDLPQLSEHGRRTWRVLASASAQGAVAGPLVLISVLAVGGLGLWQRRLTPGELFAAAQYAVIGAGLGGLTSVFAALARSMAGGKRVLELLRLDPVGHGGDELPDGGGELEFRGVSVSAPAPETDDEADDADTPASLLTDVNLRLPAGSAVAVVGDDTKSVLAELAARLRDPDCGQVLLDGVPLYRLSRRRLREAVGYAPAQPVLVGATVAEALGPNSSQDDIRDAATATHCHDFIAKLPLGYETPLDEVPMSGGERQRLGLARAWRAGRLLVLDDATSSLDTVTELRIGHALFNGDNRTRLIVTYRASTAARADLVVWLEAGRVKAVGPHAELWAVPRYREVFG
ncbi:ABC transporter ATP-binding protein [Stackebrandtia nassauensis]|uniref:ABC transporter related protein n=1 Tax=Stackebrandtia nassauensis (strain DSM 44728 / CIP 108903 / NRRL B-16338 / NBRC 102104 / LLR-40K-21) TaxID=446470 RepID=D3Q5U9_STANL|nr:ABC transporter ATP-binding protein [Stackebrandtia nassauensis]ADD40248.1 ABC transporter related protein [Stackebrandtia nassauensis DSM 44728]